MTNFVAMYHVISSEGPDNLYVNIPFVAENGLYIAVFEDEDDPNQSYIEIADNKYEHNTKVYYSFCGFADEEEALKVCKEICALVNQYWQIKLDNIQQQAVTMKKLSRRLVFEERKQDEKSIPS